MAAAGSASIFPLTPITQQPGQGLGAGRRCIGREQGAGHAVGDQFAVSAHIGSNNQAALGHGF